VSVSTIINIARGNEIEVISSFCHAKVT